MSRPQADETPQSVDEPLHLEPIVHQGQTSTVVRDAQGNLVYPSIVPPETLSPLLSGSERPRAKTLDPDKPPTPEDQHPRETRTDPPLGAGAPKRQESSASEKKERPSIDKKWATEAPRRGPRQVSTFPPVPRRAGTSYLNRAIREYQDDDSTSSSSSSSSGEEDNGAGREQMASAKRHDRLHRRHPDEYGRFRVGNENYKTKGKVKKDGRLRITVKETAKTGYLAKALGAAVKRVVPGGESVEDDQRPKPSRLSSTTTAVSDIGPRLSLNVVIMVIGSRGDAQPFLKIGKVLKEQGHRVRIATHPAFRDFVEKDSGLEFFSVGGDPSELMAFMVKNPGMIPTLETVKAGDIRRRRAAMVEMFDGFWRACVNATDDEKDTKNLKMMGEKKPFVADAIIANPPSFAHIHCAEALGIPVHLMFTFPYTPTQDFPHPLASVKKSNVDPGYTNFISYPLVEMMVWQGLGDLVNDFRVKTLSLDPVSTLWAPGATYRLHVPFTYLWSPTLVPKPGDWGDEIDVSGFVFLDLASSFKPPSTLEEFLDAGEPPVYIGFGSIVVDDADKFTQMIFDAVKLAGVRALISKGWGGLGAENVPENIYLLENTPHDWLFPKVRACVIHGGAGTTAIALKCGKPTMIVPFFGDQHFWGSMLGSSGAGPEPVPYKHLTAEKLADGIKYCLSEKAQEEARKIAESIAKEGDGAENAVRSFHKHLNLRGERSMRCSLVPDQVAVWSPKNMNMKLSSLAADILVDRGLITWKRMRLLRHTEWNDFEGPGEPLTGVAGSIIGTASEVFGGIGGVPYRLAKTSQKIREKKQRRKDAKQRRHARRLAATKGKAKKDTEREDAEDHREEGIEALKPADSDIKDHADKENSPDVTEPAKSNGLPPKQKKEAPEKPNNLDGQTTTNNGTSPDSKADPTTPQRTQPIRHDTLGAASILTQTTTGEDHPTEEYVNQVTSGVGRSAAAIAKAPVDLSLAVAQGFHNAPRLYGDTTVRRTPRVTGFKSGLRAARFEFAHGIYDGWTGVVRLPVRGAKKDGVMGFVKGTGMGLTGLVLKNFAAFAGPPAYTMKGLVKQVEREKTPGAFIRRARIIQGQLAVSKLNKDERKEVEEEVLRGWRVMKELHSALVAEQKRRGIAGAVFRKKARREVAAAFENTEVARQVLDAIKKGDPVEKVLGVEGLSWKPLESGTRVQETNQAIKQAGEEVEALSRSKTEVKAREREGMQDEENVEAQEAAAQLKAMEEQTRVG